MSKKMTKSDEELLGRIIGACLVPNRDAAPDRSGQEQSYTKEEDVKQREKPRAKARRRASRDAGRFAYTDAAEYKQAAAIASFVAENSPDQKLAATALLNRGLRAVLTAFGPDVGLVTLIHGCEVMVAVTDAMGSGGNDG